MIKKILKTVKLLIKKFLKLTAAHFLHFSLLGKHLVPDLTSPTNIIFVPTYLASNAVSVITHALRVTVLQELLGAHEAVHDPVLGLCVLAPRQPRPRPRPHTLRAHPVIAHHLHPGPGVLILCPEHKER